MNSSRQYSREDKFLSELCSIVDVDCNIEFESELLGKSAKSLTSGQAKRLVKKQKTRFLQNTFNANPTKWEGKIVSELAKRLQMRKI